VVRDSRTESAQRQQHGGFVEPQHRRRNATALRAPRRSVRLILRRRHSSLPSSSSSRPAESGSRRGRSPLTGWEAVKL
ncbi:hypothetical protein AB4Z54_55325, partial [Streptomyces sp. MCAF7]